MTWEPRRMESRKRETFIALALMCMSPQVVEAREPIGESVMVRFRHSYPICAGSCPHFELRAGPDGRVVTRSLFDGSMSRFRVIPAELKSFHYILESVRPVGEGQLDRVCVRARSGADDLDALDDPRPDDLEVRWIGPRGRARLTSCGYTHPKVRRIVQRALRALGVQPFSGRKADELDWKPGWEW